MLCLCECRCIYGVFYLFWEHVHLCKSAHVSLRVLFVCYLRVNQGRMSGLNYGRETGRDFVSFPPCSDRWRAGGHLRPRRLYTLVVNVQMSCHQLWPKKELQTMPPGDKRPSPFEHWRHTDFKKMAWINFNGNRQEYCVPRRPESVAQEGARDVRRTWVVYKSRAMTRWTRADCLLVYC